MMREYEFTALIEYSLVVEAENESEARKIVEAYSAEGWVLNAELLGLSDIDLIADWEATE